MNSSFLKENSYKKVMIVDDEPDMLEACEDVLRKVKVEVRTEQNPCTALELLRKESYDLVLTDLKMPKMDGLELLKKIRDLSPQTLVCIITSYPTIESAVEAVKMGAYDYITKPFTPDELRHLVGKALHHHQVLQENQFLKHQVEKPYRSGTILGQSPEIQRVLGLIERIGATDVDVLITGESGTGKELIARQIHRESKRSGKFVAIDCGAIPENLLESEFFGYEKGAFTGATSSRIGLLEFSHQGTLFLDELCELPPLLQSKLLRVLQERAFRRLGGKKDISVDLRIIAATNRDIEEEVKRERFREDLFYRVNVFRIEVPPLRERPIDIPLLVHHFIELYAHQMKRPLKGVEEEVLEVLQHYPWPGNVRELQNVLKRAVIMTQGEHIQLESLPEKFLDLPTEKKKTSGFFELREQRLSEFEKQYLIEVLQKHNGEVTLSAKEADVPRASFYRLLKKHFLKPEDFRRYTQQE